VERRFPWKSWGFLFYKPSTAQDPSLPLAPRPPFGDIQQHAGPGPVAFQTCDFGRILKAQWDKEKPDDLPYVTEHVTGLKNPWGLAQRGNVLYVTERGGGKITMWDADKPQTFLGTLRENLNRARFGTLPDDGLQKFTFYSTYLLPNGNPDYARVRNECSILSPEGLGIFEDGLFFGDFGTGQVTRIDLVTDAETVCCRPFISYTIQSHWLHLAITEDGVILTTTFDNATFGRARAWLPNTPVVAADGVTLTHGKEWQWQSNAYHRTVGRGATAPQVYASAIGAGNRMIVQGSSGGGFAVYVKASANDPLPDPVRMKAGYEYYCAMGYRLRYGNYGFAHIKGPLPWGEFADMDYWFEYHGHRRAAVPSGCAAIEAERDALRTKIANFKRALA